MSDFLVSALPMSADVLIVSDGIVTLASPLSACSPHRKKERNGKHA